MTGDNRTERELRRLLAAIALTANQSFDVGDLEPYLADLLEFLRAADTDRAAATQILVALADDWPPGSVEAVEFTMRDLQWSELRSALEAQLGSDADFRIKDQTRRVLEVFQPAWAGGEIYERYRPRAADE